MIKRIHVLKKRKIDASLRFSSVDEGRIMGPGSTWDFPENIHMIVVGAIAATARSEA